jgi:PAS domain S-box-containing protein
VNIAVFKDNLNVIVYCITIATAIITFLKWGWPKIKPIIENINYITADGIHVIKDIEHHLGKEAGKVLKEMISKNRIEVLVDELRLNIIENNIGLGIFICNPEGICTYSNKTLAKMFGLSQAEMIGHGWVGPIVDKEKAFNNWKFSVNNKVPYRDEYMVRVNGVEHRYYAEAEPSVADKTNEVLGYVGIVKKVN